MFDLMPLFVYDFRKMLIWMTVGLSVLVLDAVHAGDDIQPIYQYISGGNKSNFRKARSAPGTRIVALIKSAVEVPTKSKQYRRYMKHGSVSDAVEDFEKLKPTNVKRRLYSTDAFVGDVELQLKKMDKSQYRQPSIKISYPDGVGSIKIVYTEDEININIP